VLRGSTSVVAGVGRTGRSGRTCAERCDQQRHGSRTSSHETPRHAHPLGSPPGTVPPRHVEVPCRRHSCRTSSSTGTSMLSPTGPPSIPCPVR